MVWRFLLVSILSGVVSFPVNAIGQDESWETANSEGMRAYRQGRYADAKQWFLQALSESERLGEANPRQAMTLNNLAAVQEALGEYERAELRYRQSLTVIEGLQGSNHPDLVSGLNNLALLYAKLGDFDQAIPLWRRSLRILEQTLGDAHPHLIPSLMTLAQVSQAKGWYDQAEQFYARALEIAEAELDPTHQQTTTILLKYAAFLRETNQMDKAAELEDRMKAIQSHQSQTPARQE